MHAARGPERGLGLVPGLEIGAHRSWNRMADSAYSAAECEEPEGFGLAGCTVAPGFEFEEFEMGDQDFLAQHWPQHAELSARLSNSR